MNSWGCAGMVWPGLVADETALGGCGPGKAPSSVGCGNLGAAPAAKAAPGQATPRGEQTQLKEHSLPQPTAACWLLLLLFTGSTRQPSPERVQGGKSSCS